MKIVSCADSSVPEATASGEGDAVGVLLERDDRHDGVAAQPLHGGNVVGDHELTGRDLVALLDVHREPLALELHGVDAEVHEDADAVGRDDDVGVGERLQDRAADRGDRLEQTARGSIAPRDRLARRRSDPDVLHANGPAQDQCQDGVALICVLLCYGDCGGSVWPGARVGLAGRSYRG